MRKGFALGRSLCAYGGTTFDPRERIAGNVLLTGHGWERTSRAWRASALLRNSVADAVVAVGDHVASTGREAADLERHTAEFGAGMSGGIAYVLDEEGDFETRVNPETVDLDPMDDQDLDRVQRLVRRHFQYTRSERADEILRKWNAYAPKFVKVFPKDYKRAQGERIAAESGNG